MLQSFFGIFLIVGMAWLMGERRKSIPWKKIGIALLLQIALAALFLKVPFLVKLMLPLNELISILDLATASGTSFLFGYLAGSPPPFEVVSEQANYLLAFKLLPIIIVMSAISAALLHIGVLQWVTGLFSKLLKKTIGLNGPLGFGVAANVYFGVEVPFFVKPYLQKMSRSELFLLMGTGMATVAGTTMFTYALALEPIMADAITHILVASIISIPSAFVICQIMMPAERTSFESESSERFTVKPETQGLFDAFFKGAIEGAQAVINIGAFIIAFFAAVYLVNSLLSVLPFDEPITLQRILGYLCWPLVWSMGISVNEAAVASELLGVKLALNEFVAYVKMAGLPGDALTQRSQLILTYAVCSFSSIGSIGLLMGVYCSVIPSRRLEIINLSFRAVVAGLLASCLTGALVGVLI